MSDPCDHHRKMGFTFSVIGCPSCVALAATSSPAGNGEPLKCSDCGPYAPCPKHDEGTRDAAPGLREDVLRWAFAQYEVTHDHTQVVIDTDHVNAAAIIARLYRKLEREHGATPPSEAPSPAGNGEPEDCDCRLHAPDRFEGTRDAAPGLRARIEALLMPMEHLPARMVGDPDDIPRCTSCGWLIKPATNLHDAIGHRDGCPVEAVLALLAATPPSEAPSGGPDPEFAWLIERGQPEGIVPPVWMVKGRWGLATGYTWTADAYKAHRFASKAEAEAFIEAESGVLPRQRFIGRAVEHGFARLSPTPGQGDGLRDRLEAIPGLNAPGPDGQFRHWKPWDEIAAAIEGTRDAAPGLDPHLYSMSDASVHCRCVPPSEAPSGGLDPERLARALGAAGLGSYEEKGPDGKWFHPLARERAEAVIAEYNRLSPTPGQGDSDE